MPHKIMIVEDEEDVALIVSAILERLGYETRCVVTRGEGVLDSVREYKPDLILMDIVLKLGETRGVDIAIAIREKFDTPVIFLTGMDDEECFEMARVAEPFGFILKPFRNLELRAAIEMGLHKAQANAELKKYKAHLEELVTERTAELEKINLKLRDEIAERKLAEEKIEKSERRYRALAEGAEDAIFIIDKADRINYVNSYAAQLFGRTPEELIGQPRASLFPPNRASSQKIALEEVFSTGNSFRSESSIEYPHKEIWMDHYLVPLKDNNNQVYAVLGISREITSRKEAEKSLETSLKEKEILLKEIHHRVKNNLQAISSLLNLQAGQFQEPRLRKAFNHMRDRIRAMAQVHEKLYASDNIAYIEFGDHAKSIAQDLVRAYGGDKTEIELETDQVHIELEKAVPLSLILNELVSNALIHGFPDRNTGILKIGLHRIADNGFSMVIWNNGKDFPEDVDIYNTSTLGLTLVNALVNQIDGTLELSKDNGTTFTIKLNVAGNTQKE